MHLSYTFVLASVIFASSVVAKPAVAISQATRQVETPACTNTLPLDTDTANCFVFQTQNTTSVADCKTAGGAYYYCVTAGQAACFPIETYSTDLTGGECFNTPF